MLKKRGCLLSLALTIFSMHVFAQGAANGRITATVVDETTNDALPGVVVTVESADKNFKARHSVAAYKGAVDITSLPYGQYTVTFAFMGYGTVQKQVTVGRSAQTAKLGVVQLKESTYQMDAVVKEVKAIRTSQKGDTVSYHASAFKVTADADVEGLLKKMPGLTVSNGEVKAQGESVKKIFVDGKEFFGEDVTTAIKSLPAQSVDKIEVYNKLSDNAEFSGMDDGEGYKAINIVTHKSMRQGVFGKLYAGYGYQPQEDEVSSHNKYLAGGNVNVFNGSSRVSVIGLFNNVNQQNFSFEDVLGVTGGNAGGGHGSSRGAWQYMTRPQDGVATVNSVGVNYSDTWGKRDQVSFQGSYFFNNTTTRNVSTKYKWYESPSPIDTLESVGRSNTVNYNNRVSARVEWKISDNQSLMSRTSVSFQTNKPLSSTTGRQWGQSGYSVIDDWSSSKKTGYNVREFLQYRVKLGKAGRTLSVDGNFRWYENDNAQRSYSNTEPPLAYTNPQDTVGAPVSLLYQRVVNPSSSYDVGGTLTYTEPLSKSWQLSLQYRAQYSSQQSDKSAYSGVNDFNSLVLNPALSNSYRSGYLVNKVGPGVKFAKDKNSFIVNAFYQLSTLDGSVVASDSDKISRTYNDFTYFLMGQFYINSENSIRLFASSYTQNPSVTQLQNVYDISNAQYISKGNPNLNPSYSNYANLTYTLSLAEKGQTLMVMLGAQNANNYITNSVEFNKQLVIDGQTYTPLQYSSMVNMDGYWNLSANVDYGFPIKFIKSNLNVGVGAEYSVLPSMIGGKSIYTNNMGYMGNVVLGSNISENIDFTVSWDGAYNEATNNESRVSQSTNRYFSHAAAASLKAVFWKGFTFTGSFQYTQYLGLTNDYNDQYMLCNLYIGKKLFKNNQGEVLVGVNDLLNQNKAFVRTVSSGYAQNVTNSVIGRYFTVQFVYNLRYFSKNGSTNSADYDSTGSSSKSSKGQTPPPPRNGGAMPPRGPMGF